MATVAAPNVSALQKERAFFFYMAVAVVATGIGRTPDPVSDALNRSTLLSLRPRVLSSLHATSNGPIAAISTTERLRPISYSGNVSLSNYP